MANINVLNEKVAKAEEKVAKCKKTIERHEKQLDKKVAVLTKKGLGITLENRAEFKFKEGIGGTEHYWDICEVDSKLRDIEGAKKKLAEAERILGNWIEKLNVEVEKENIISNDVPQAIIEFMEKWYENTLAWYLEKYEGFKDYKIKIQNKSELNYREKAEYLQAYGGSVILHMDTIRNPQEREAYLVRILKREKQGRILDLKYRIEGHVGNITDAKGLHMHLQNINGVVIGDKGRVKVETISAGGYHIQRYHYRTLITPC